MLKYKEFTNTKVSKFVVIHDLLKVVIVNKKLAQSQLVITRADSNLTRVCKKIKVTLLKLKGCFISIKNDLIEIAPFPGGYFDNFLLAFIPKLDDLRG